MTRQRVERRLGWVTVDGQRYPRQKADEWLDAVRAGLCPWCGSGPFTVPASHIRAMHGVDRRELRDLLGLPLAESICDPTHHAAVVARNRSDPRRTSRMAFGRSAESRAKGTAMQLKRRAVRRPVAPERWRGARLNAEKSAQLWAKRDAALCSGSTLSELAAVEGVRRDYLRDQFAKRRRAGQVSAPPPVRLDRVLARRTEMLATMTLAEIAVVERIELRALKQWCRHHGFYIQVEKRRGQG